MIHQVLVDYRDSGDYFRFSIDSTEEPQDILEYFQQYSHDVRYWRSQEEPRRNEKGTRVTPVGTLISCGYFGTKIGYQMRFESSDYRLKGMNDSIPDERHVIAIG